MRQSVWVVTLALIVRALVCPQPLRAQVATAAVPPGVELPQPIGRQAVAEWVRSFSSADDLIAGVDLVVVATAGTPEPGRIVARRGGAPPLRFEFVPLVVNEILRARPPVGAKVGDTIRLDRLGDAISLKGVRTVSDYDLGPLVPGKTYVLFLDRQPAPPFAFIQVTDEARYELDRDGALVSSADGQVAESFKGRRLDWLRSTAANK